MPCTVPGTEDTPMNKTSPNGWIIREPGSLGKPRRVQSDEVVEMEHKMWVLVM